MELLYYLATFCLVLFMALATYDGFYLHIWKYQLFVRSESQFEHKTHTIRAILFPIIVWLLFVDQSSVIGFYCGLFLVAIDLVVLGLDAYHEKESRSFMGGLPKWEYIIHLFSNAFHFSAIAMAVTIKANLLGFDIVLLKGLVSNSALSFFNFVSINTIPGGVILAILHLVLLYEKPAQIWTMYRSKVNCC